MSGREQLLNAETGNNQTCREPWTLKRVGHWYDYQADFALANLPKEGKCLVVGSPIFEAMEIRDRGLEVTYLDCRKPDVEISHVEADATDMPFPDGSFDCVSSTCVLCHAGLGRYGDKVIDNGDEKMLKEISRVLKSGGKAVLTFGPVSRHVTVARIDTCHRIYSIPEAERMTESVGMKMVSVMIFDILNGMWRYDLPEDDRLDRFYLSAVLSK